MYKLSFVVLLFAASTQAYYGGSGVGGSSGRSAQLIDVRQLADDMSMEYGRGAGSGASLLGGAAAVGGLSGSAGVGTLFLGGGGGGEDDGGAILSSGGGFSGAFSSAAAAGGGGGGFGSIAVQRAPTRVDFVPVPSNEGPAEPTNIVVDSHSSPINLIVRSLSAGVNLDVQHIPSKGTFRQTESEDEPSHHRHTIRKPVIQEIHEIITPIRRVVQEVLPVQEDIETKVPRAVNALPVVAAAPAAPALLTQAAPAPLAAPLAAPLLPAPVPLLGGFVPVRSARSRCSKRVGGCSGAVRKLAGTVVPVSAFGHSLGGAY